MGVEIERKFLVTDAGWRDGAATRIRQGYLSRDPARTVRVRVADGRAYLTVKGPNDGPRRAEYEYPIPRADADELLALCAPPIIDKTRYVSVYCGTRWEVDEFLGANAGLVVAEVELPAADAPFARPAWLGREVTDDARYYNANLAARPYSTWCDGGA